MKTARLNPFREPPLREKRSCSACGVFAPECLVPVGDVAKPMCWVCAHFVVEHESEPVGATCSCPPSAIYPGRADAEAPAKEAPRPTDRATEREALLKSETRLREWAREAHKQMSAAQHEAVKRRLAKS